MSLCSGRINLLRRACVLFFSLGLLSACTYGDLPFFGHDAKVASASVKGEEQNFNFRPQTTDIEMPFDISVLEAAPLNAEIRARDGKVWRVAESYYSAAGAKCKKAELKIQPDSAVKAVLSVRQSMQPYHPMLLTGYDKIEPYIPPPPDTIKPISESILACYSGGVGFTVPDLKR